MFNQTSPLTQAQPYIYPSPESRRCEKLPYVYKHILLINFNNFHVQDIPLPPPYIKSILTNLCADNAAIRPMPLAHVLVQQELGHLRGFATSGFAPNYSDAVLVDNVEDLLA